MGDRDRNRLNYERNQGRGEYHNDAQSREQHGWRDWDSPDYWRGREGERSESGSRRFPGTFGSYEDQRYERDAESRRRFESDRNYGSYAEDRSRQPYGTFNQTYGSTPGGGYVGSSSDPYYGGSDWERSMGQERSGSEWNRDAARRYGSSHEGGYRPRGDSDEGFGQQVRDTAQHVFRKVKHAFRGPKGYKRSDERIREDVNDRLAQQSDFDPSEIEVSVSNGEVTLTGTVRARHEKFRAEEIADDVSGVRDIHNQLRVHWQQADQTSETTTSSGAQAGADMSRSRNARMQQP